MTGILHSTEEAFIMFVLNRIPQSDWKHILSPIHILARMEDDDENEIKDYIWGEIKSSINWGGILQEVRTMAQNILDSEEEEEEAEQDEESD